MDEVNEAKVKWIQSADAWIEGMKVADKNRTHLLDPAMLKAIGDVRRLRVLDIGCGEGRFCRMLADRGATVTGVDLTPALLTEARRLHPSGEYVEAGAEHLPFRDAEFDLAVSYVVLVDVADFRKAIKEMARITKQGGRIVTANVNSFMSTSQSGWIKDGSGQKLHFPVDGYFEERALRLQWSGMSVINWHRPLEAYISAYLDAGLNLVSFSEPRPSAEALAVHPSMVDETRVALFNVMVWQKPKVA